jgi:endonuclease YncB( thermonuclease family)
MNLRRILTFFSGIILLILLSTVSPSFAMKATLSGKVMQVKDGDTVVISPEKGGQFVICRLYGIDAPEATKQPYGRKFPLLPGTVFGERSREKS